MGFNKTQTKNFNTKNLEIKNKEKKFLGLVTFIRRLGTLD